MDGRNFEIARGVIIAYLFGCRIRLCRVYTSRLVAATIAATIAAIEQAIVPATRLRIVAAMQIISIKNKLYFWSLHGHNNVRFIAYGSQWLDWHKKGKFKITRSQELQSSITFKVKLTVPNIFQLILRISIDIIIVGLHFRRKQCDVNNTVHPRQTLRCDWCSFG